MRYFLTPILALLIAVVTFGENALSIGNDSNVLVIKNLLVEENLDVHGEIPLPL